MSYLSTILTFSTGRNRQFWNFPHNRSRYSQAWDPCKWSFWCEDTKSPEWSEQNKNGLSLQTSPWSSWEGRIVLPQDNLFKVKITFEDHAEEILCLETFFELDQEGMWDLLPDFHFIDDWLLVDSLLVSSFFYKFNGIKSSIFAATGEIHLTEPSDCQTIINFIVENPIWVLLGHKTLEKETLTNCAFFYTQQVVCFQILARSGKP